MALEHRYHCRWSSQPAFSTGVSLDDVPMRRADNARILDTSRHGFQHSGAWRGEKVAVRRAAPEGGGGGVEVQTRLYVGKLPVAYKVDGAEGSVYVMDDAVDETPPADSESAAVPVPPCCVLLDGGAGVRLEIADRGTAAGIVSIRPDDVLLQTRSSVANEKCNEEVLEWLSRALALRRSTLSVVSGRFKRHKVVQCAGMSREALYGKLQDAVARGFSVAVALKPTHGARPT